MFIPIMRDASRELEYFKEKNLLIERYRSDLQQKYEALKCWAELKQTAGCASIIILSDGKEHCPAYHINPNSDSAPQIIDTPLMGKH